MELTCKAPPFRAVLITMHDQYASTPSREALDGCERAFAHAVKTIEALEK